MISLKLQRRFYQCSRYFCFVLLFSVQVPININVTKEIRRNAKQVRNHIAAFLVVTLKQTLCYRELWLLKWKLRFFFRVQPRSSHYYWAKWNKRTIELKSTSAFLTNKLRRRQWSENTLKTFHIALVLRVL